MLMKRTCIFFPEPMLVKLNELSKLTGFTVSELVRQAVADFLRKRD